MHNKITLTVIASCLITAGALLTLENFGVLQGISRHWPLLIIIVGGGFVSLFFERRRMDNALLWIGSFMVYLGLFFYYLNFTSWTLLSYLWSGFIGIVGCCFMTIGIASKDRLYLVLAVILLALFLVFYLVFGVSLKLWPLSMIIFGLSLLCIGPFGRRLVDYNKEESHE